MNHSIGKTIAELRKEKGWTQIELAEKLQVSDKTVSKWEQDNGAPSIEFFPILAEVFGISIDYLMTGKKVEPKIIAMSKLELCAKNDDVSMARDISLTTTDENGKTLIDYIIQYNSYNVFSAICDTQVFIDLLNKDYNNVRKFNVLTLIEFALITNKISVMDRKIVLDRYHSVNNIKDLRHVEDLAYAKINIITNEKHLCILTDKILDIIVQDKRVNENTIDYLLSKQKEKEYVWYLVLPYILHQSYLYNKKELFDKVLNASIVNNQYAYDNISITRDFHRGYNQEQKYFTVSNRFLGKKEFGLVRALEKTIKLALERSDIETVEKLNDLNTAIMKYCSQFTCYVATMDEIRISKLKTDKTISEKEIEIQKTIHNGVVCLDELYQLKDFKVKKATLEKYPIHVIERVYPLYEGKKWKELFECAIDYNCSSLASAIIQKDNEEIEMRILEHFWFNVDRQIECVNYEHLYLIENGQKRRILNEGSSSFGPGVLEGVVSAVKKVKERIFEELSLKKEKEKTTGDLTKDYFVEQMRKENYLELVVNLCRKLEGILKYDYHYEGEFSEMLDKYCNTQIDPYGETARLLNKLRRQRNNMVHPERKGEELSLEEIQRCIDYICNLG